MKLRAEVAEPIAFLRQPAGAKVPAGGSHTMGVEVEGGPVRYQWFKDSAAISAATNRTLPLANIQTNATGTYQVVASNYHGARWSEPAVVSLAPSSAGDLTGPRVVSAAVRLFGLMTEHVFWWAGPGFALESTTNLSLGSGSHPFGPWLEVTNMSNPYTNVVSPGSDVFFRLKRE